MYIEPTRTETQSHKEISSQAPWNTLPVYLWLALLWVMCVCLSSVQWHTAQHTHRPTVTFPISPETENESLSPSLRTMTWNRLSSECDYEWDHYSPHLGVFLAVTRELGSTTFHWVLVAFSGVRGGFLQGTVLFPWFITLSIRCFTRPALPFSMYFCPRCELHVDFNVFFISS